MLAVLSTGFKSVHAVTLWELAHRMGTLGHHKVLSFIWSCYSCSWLRFGLCNSAEQYRWADNSPAAGQQIKSRCGDSQAIWGCSVVCFQVMHVGVTVLALLQVKIQMSPFDALYKIKLICICSHCRGVSLICGFNRKSWLIKCVTFSYGRYSWLSNSNN